MSRSAPLQPDQQPRLWNDYVGAYEAVFEPLTNAFARAAIEHLEPGAGKRLLDVAAGSGGAALHAARLGADVVAIDASRHMAARIRARAAHAGFARRIHAAVMDGTAIALPEASVDSAVSIFGVVLFADAAAGMREIARVLVPGGRAAVVTWTEPERYELVGRLIGAAASAGVALPPPATPPAQLRFREEREFRTLFAAAGLKIDRLIRLEERLHAPSARWIAEHIEFAPGMAAMIGALGNDRERVLAHFVAALERDQGTGEVAMAAVAWAGVATKPA